jgi:hypothetical protein
MTRSYPAILFFIILIRVMPSGKALIHLQILFFLYKLKFDDVNILCLLYEGLRVSSLYWPTPWVDVLDVLGRSKRNTSRDVVINISGYSLIVTFDCIACKRRVRVGIGFYHGKRCVAHARFMAYVDPIVCVVMIMLLVGDALAYRASR